MAVGSMSGLYIGASGLMTNQNALNTTAHNLANVDTPNYKRKDVSFQSYLQQALVGDDSLDERIAGINTHLSDFSGYIYTDSSSLSYRLDGNNVDVDTENSMLAQNQIRYNTLVEQIGQEFARYKTVLSS